MYSFTTEDESIKSNMTYNNNCNIDIRKIPSLKANIIRSDIDTIIYQTVKESVGEPLKKIL